MNLFTLVPKNPSDRMPGDRSSHRVPKPGIRVLLRLRVHVVGHSALLKGSGPGPRLYPSAAPSRLDEADDVIAAEVMLGEVAGEQ